MTGLLLWIGAAAHALLLAALVVLYGGAIVSVLLALVS